MSRIRADCKHRARRNFSASPGFKVPVNASSVTSAIALARGAMHVYPIMSRAFLPILSLLLTLWQVTPVLAQDAPPPPPPGERDQRDHPDSRRGMKPGSGPYGDKGDRDRGDMFKDMTEEQRQKVRAAFDKVWSRPEVTAAREDLMKANEGYRKAMRDALMEIDPEVVKLLDKAKPPMPMGGFPMLGRLPDVKDPEFRRKILSRLGAEWQSWSRAENRDAPPPALLDRLLENPTVREALTRLQEAPEEQRMEAWKQLRDAYHGAMKGEGGRGPEGGPPRNGGPPRDKPPGDGPPREGPSKDGSKPEREQ
jgi:Spy/CpxP family protein refolding chaperone